MLEAVASPNRGEHRRRWKDAGSTLIKNRAAGGWPGPFFISGKSLTERVAPT